MNTQEELQNDFVQEPSQRTRAWRRKINAHKALHKKHISSYYCTNKDWYNNLHQYSKNKVHCSCPMCSRKTNKMSYGEEKGRHYGKNLSHMDLKAWERMKYDYKEFMQPA